MFMVFSCCFCGAKLLRYICQKIKDCFGRRRNGGRAVADRHANRRDPPVNRREI